MTVVATVTTANMTDENTTAVPVVTESPEVLQAECK